MKLWLGWTKLWQVRIHSAQGAFALNRVSNIFSQILDLVLCRLFDRVVRKHKVERHAPGFAYRDQFFAMLFCQLAQSKRLEEISEGLQTSEGKSKHLGLTGTPSHSMLAYANPHHSWRISETLFGLLLG